MSVTPNKCGYYGGINLWDDDSSLGGPTVSVTFAEMDREGFLMAVVTMNQGKGPISQYFLGQQLFLAVVFPHIYISPVYGKWNQDVLEDTLFTTQILPSLEVLVKQI